MIVRVRRRKSSILYDVQVPIDRFSPSVARKVLQAIYPDHPYGEVWQIAPGLSKGLARPIEMAGYRVSPNSTRSIRAPRKSATQYPPVLAVGLWRHALWAAFEQARLERGGDHA